MKNVTKILGVLAVVLGVFAVACGGAGASFGEPVSENPAVAITDVLKKGESADGESALVEGKVIAVCPGGHWIDVADGSGNVLHVIAGGDFSFPQSLVGKDVKAEGKLRYIADKSAIEMVATGVAVV